MQDSIDRRAARREQRQRLGAAIRRARGPITQQELGDRIGEAQTTLSRWETGEVELEIGQAARIEDALRLPHGWIARAAGLVDTQGLAEETPDDFIRMGYFDTYEEALVEVNAAATLGLGVGLSNRMVPWGEGDGMVEQWVVVLRDSPEERTF